MSEGAVTTPNKKINCVGNVLFVVEWHHIQFDTIKEVFVTSNPGALSLSIKLTGPLPSG